MRDFNMQCVTGFQHGLCCPHYQKRNERRRRATSRRPQKQPTSHEVFSRSLITCVLKKKVENLKSSLQAPHRSLSIINVPVSTQFAKKMYSLHSDSWPILLPKIWTKGSGGS
eukprot:Tbor_TRINITY_DN5577_c4_g4::TRINITY_DN5577_c4_g4_i2::g.12711::m.12711